MLINWSIVSRLARVYFTQSLIDVVVNKLTQLKRRVSLHNKIYITASGGPFLNYKPSKLKSVKPAKALKHPKWKMGKKISIDSATLMNKILELIEAQRLFNIPKEKLDIIIHPNSLVHAIIDLKNGLKKFIYHETTMIIPIANAIFDRNLEIKKIIKVRANHEMIKNLTFKKVDRKIFPIIKLVNQINKYEGTPIIVNAANEVLVDHFLRKLIIFFETLSAVNPK